MFKPALTFIRKRQDFENGLEKDISKREENLLKLQKQKQEKLDYFKTEMKKKYSVEPAGEADISSKIKPDIDKQEAQRLVQIAKKILVEKVPHVD